MALQYTCPLCPYETRLRGILYRHLLIHTGVKPYCCQHCGRRYALPETLLRHMANHRREPPFQCSRCAIALDHFSEYLRHQVYHVLKSIHRCSFCGEGFVWKQALKHHARVHKDSRHLFHMFFRRRPGATRPRDENDAPLDLKVRVPVRIKLEPQDAAASLKSDNGVSSCLDQDRALSLLQVQPPLLSPLGNLLSPGCTPLLDNYFKLYMYPHLNLLPYQNGLLSPGSPEEPNGASENGYFVCRVCGWQFAKVSHLTAHMYVHTGRRLHGCDICSKTFTRKGSLKLHRLQHLDEKPYRCEICRKTFLQARYLRAHLLVHRRQEASSRPAEPTCDASPALQHHLSTVAAYHETMPSTDPPMPEPAESPESSLGATPSSSAHRCPVCQKGFSQPYKLRRHLVIHASPRIHQCNICQKVLPSVTELRSHKKSHGRARLHCCDYCKKDFSCSSTLRRHVRIHTGEKPYQCEVCFKRFSDLSNKNCHMRTHTGEKPYRCQVCSMKFSLKNALNCHMRNHML